jgi:hypothetical protein
VAEDGRDVRGDEELAIAEADDDRRTVADSHDLVRVVCRDQHEAEQPAHVEQRTTDGILEPVVFHFTLDQVRDDLGVRLGDERVPFLLELPLQVEIVLDDSVVDDHDAAGAVAVRVRVLFGRPAVRGPARVPDPILAFQRMRGDDFFQPRQLACAPPQLDESITHDGDSGRVVPAVLEAAEAVNQNGDEGLPADISDDSAHTSRS